MTRTARTLASVTLSWTVVALVAVAALLTALRSVALPLLSQNTGADTRAACTLHSRCFVWTAPLNAVADAGALLLNAEGRFAAAAGRTAVECARGVIVLVAWHGSGIDALVWSLLAGLAAQTLVVLIAVRGAGIRLRPGLILPATLPRMLGTVALPCCSALLLGNLIPAFVQIVSVRAGTGAISAIGLCLSTSQFARTGRRPVSFSGAVAALCAPARRGEKRRTARHAQRVFAATLLLPWPRWYLSPQAARC